MVVNTRRRGRVCDLMGVPNKLHAGLENNDFPASFKPLSVVGVAVLQESPHPAGCGSLTAAPPSLHLQGTLETMAHL